ncbi:cystatin-like [Sebastes umbrosus]|uniref:cystatin-like n=1 Tax=Sebastes umbrosus TaxID=72105 RepID=UPI0018A0D1BA|nr:cystatin-like [Sebastes umbrosus]
MFVWVCIIVCASVSRFIAGGQVMVGRPRGVPVNSTGVLTAARFAVGEFNKANADDRFAYKIVNITSAEMQVVSGINYILDMQLGRTMCRKNDTADSEPCAFSSEHKELQCHFIITEVPWEHTRVLTQKKCHP